MYSNGERQLVCISLSIITLPVITPIDHTLRNDRFVFTWVAELIFGTLISTVT